MRSSEYANEINWKDMFYYKIILLITIWQFLTIKLKKKQTVSPKMWCLIQMGKQLHVVLLVQYGRIFSPNTAQLKGGCAGRSLGGDLGQAELHARPAQVEGGTGGVTAGQEAADAHPPQEPAGRPAAPAHHKRSHQHSQSYVQDGPQNISLGICES